MKEAKKIRILIEMDIEYTEDFKSVKEYREEIKGVKEELLKNIPNMTNQIYSIKLTNQTVRDIVTHRW